MKRRWSQHCARPNKAMAADILQGSDFKSTYTLDVLWTTAIKSQADHLEKREIKDHKANDKALGYNCMSGAHAHDKRFFWIMKANKK